MTEKAEQIETEDETIEEVEQEESLEDKVADLQDKLVRSYAELENTRKRLQRQIEDAGKYGITSFARDLLPVLDNLERAADNITDEQLEDETFKNVKAGINLTRSEFEKSLSKANIEVINPKGEAFDHNFHESVTKIENPDFKSGDVVDVVQKGYKIHDRLLRPALVVVCK